MPNEHYPWHEVESRLREAAERENAPAWQPEQGDELVGFVVALNEAAPTAYGSAPVVELERANGERVSVWLFHATLRREFERAKVRAGEAVLIRYHGKVQPDGGGNAYASYTLVVDRPPTGAEFDWRAVAERYGDELAPGAPEPSGSSSSSGSPLPDDDIPF
jgi:hypothetical protein